MIREKLLDSVRIAYNFGVQQTNKRIEPRDTVISWCGYSKLPKVHENMIYAAYRSGLYNRKDDQKEYRLFMVTDKKIAILTDIDGQIYRLLFPYKTPRKITYETYCEMVYEGVVHNDPTFRKLDEIRRDLE